MQENVQYSNVYIVRCTVIETITQTLQPANNHVTLTRQIWREWRYLCDSTTARLLQSLKRQTDCLTDKQTDCLTDRQTVRITAQQMTHCHYHYDSNTLHLIHLGRAPLYLVDCVQPVNIGSTRHLRSSDTTDYLKRTTRTKFGERGFSYSGPVAWNSLSLHLRTITDTNAFKRHLYSFLFTVFLIVLLAFLDKLYSGAIQITGGRG